MSSEVEVCNIALSHTGTRSTISALTEESAEARQCSILYKPARDFVLRAAQWKFAQKRVALALLTTPTWEWLYRYQMPSDCLNANEIIPQSRNVSAPVPFEIGASDDLNSKNIFTDQEGAELRYTGKITNASVFDPAFVQALAWWLATQLILPLTGDKVARDKALLAYKSAMSAATTYDQNEGQRDPRKDREAEQIEGRN